MKQITFFTCTLLFLYQGSFCSENSITKEKSSLEVDQFLQEIAKDTDEEILPFFDDLMQKPSLSDDDRNPFPLKKQEIGHLQKCRRDSCFSLDLPKHSPRLLVFISFSVPKESWKVFSHTLEKTEGVFVLRGIPENSFRTFASKTIELKEEGINAPIQIDPEAFDRYQINTVPTIVLETGDSFDTIHGNLPIETALRHFADSGSTSSFAKTILAQIQEKNYMHRKEGESHE